MYARFAAREDRLMCVEQTQSQMLSLLQSLAGQTPMPNQQSQSSSRLEAELGKLASKVASIGNRLASPPRPQCTTVPANSTRALTASANAQPGLTAPVPTQANLSDFPPLPPTTTRHAGTIALASLCNKLPTKPASQPSLAQLRLTNANDSTFSQEWQKVLKAKNPSGEIKFVVQFQVNALNQSDRLVPMHVCAPVNKELEKHNLSQQRGLRVLSAKWNNVGNCVLFFLPGTDGTHIQEVRHIIRPIIAQDRHIVISMDVQWSKTVIKGVDCRFKPGDPIWTPTQLGVALRCDPLIKKLKLDITQEPWFVSASIADQSLTADIVFAYVDPDDSFQKELLRQGAISMLGSRHGLRRWYSKETFTQCKRCWELGHKKPHCSNFRRGWRCCICAQFFQNQATASDHRAHCAACVVDGNSNTNCPHPPKCTACKGEHEATFADCPTRNKYRVPATDDRVPEVPNPANGSSPDINMTQ
jgi:hypothetical protein